MRTTQSDFFVGALSGFAFLNPLFKRIARRNIELALPDTMSYRLGDYFYYSRTEQGKQYPIYARKKGTLEAPEEILLDVNVLAEGKKFMSVGSFQISDDTKRLAYTTDDNGYRQYKLQVMDLASGETRPLSSAAAAHASSSSWVKSSP